MDLFGFRFHSLLGLAQSRDENRAVVPVVLYLTCETESRQLPRKAGQLVHGQPQGRALPSCALVLPVPLLCPLSCFCAAAFCPRGVSVAQRPAGMYPCVCPCVCPSVCAQPQPLSFCCHPPGVSECPCVSPVKAAGLQGGSG